MKYVLAIGFLIMVPFVGTANAGSAGSGEILRIDVNGEGGTNGEGTFVFYLSSTHVSAPSCHTQGDRWVVDLGLASGRAVMSVVLAAYLSGKTVKVWYGSGDCNVRGQTETAVSVSTP